MEWIWLAIIIIAIILDIFTSDFLFAGFALSALVALILNAIGLNLIIQIIVFGIIGIAFIFTIYPMIKKKISKDIIPTKLMEENYIGRKFILTKDLNPDAQIKFDGIYWIFKSEDESLTIGTQVEIIKVDGNKIIVKKFNN